jgi:multidrug efflux pump subunit AcrB/outer membrane protein TolC
MNLPQLSLKYPYLVLALVLMVVVMGTLAYVVVPTDLFPETVPPQVAVITVAPGVSARDIADKVTRNIEKELGSLAGLKRISSVSRDEVSAITAEFLFSKPMGEAVIDVQNAVARVRGILPSDIREPLLYRITDATRPLVTLAVSPGPDSLKTLSDIRLLAENDLRDEIMAVPGVGDVQVFGGHTPEIEIRVDRDALSRHRMNIADVISGLARQNVAAPGGIVYGARQEYLLKVSGELSGLQALEEMPLAVDSGSQILLRDVAQVRAGESDPRSRYHGNSKEAVALNVLRPEKGHTIKALAALKKALPGIKADYPDILFEITDDQQPLIDLNVRGMRSSLWQAMLLTILLIFVFLADLRAAAVVGAAIPLSFLAALIVLWISPYTLNMVTLSGLIVAVGMVVDASVVVLENIHRHHKQNNYTDAVKAALTGAGQVAMPITAGMLTTVAVLVPVIFTIGYTGRTMRPLNITIVSTLVASLIVSLTVIPILAARFFKGPDKISNRVRYLLSPVQKGVEFLTTGYEGLVTLALKYRWVTAIILLVFMIFSLRVVKPLLGGEQMPPMDTGIVTIQFDTDSSARPEEVNTTLSQIEAILNQHPAVLTISSVVGSEPGAVSFGGGKATSQSANITVRLTPRTQRVETIWEIEARWRKHLGKLPGVRTFRVSEYGATPVSTTKAPFNAILSGPDPFVLNNLADKAMDLLDGTPGLMDLRRSWYLDKIEQKIIVDPHLAVYYGTSPAEVASFLRMAVQGVVATTMRLDGFYDLPVRVRYRADQVDDLARLEELFVPTRSGSVRLGNMAKIITLRTQPFITRENQRTTMDITAGNYGLTIAQATAAAKKRLTSLSLPKGYTLDIAGTAKDMQETQVSLGNALVVGLALLFILLMAMFKSLAHPITILLSIPLAAAGGVWGLLLFDKPFCMPALMGFILLGGTIVNNAILMLDFIIEARKKGLGKDEAILQSVRLRLRPILITAVSTMVGFSPLIFETAVGLERMSPLGIAAASGLLVGTIVTLVAVPVIYSLLDSLKIWLARIWNTKKIASGTIALLLIFAVFCAPAKVQATTFSDSLSLDEAVRIALEHNPEIETARAQIDLLQGGVMQTKAAGGIHMNLIGQTGWSGKKHAQVLGLSSMEQGFANLRYQGTLSANWLLTDFGKTEARLRSALTLHKAGIALEHRKQQEIVFAVSLQFLKTMTIRDLLEATCGTRDSLQAFAQSIRSQIAKGRAPEVDALKIDIRLAEVESQLAELGMNLQVSRAALSRLMGVEEELPDLASSPMADIEAPKPEAPGIPDMKNRLDIKAQELMVQAGQERILAAEQSFLPRVEFFANAGLYGATDPETGTGQVDDDPWKNDVSGGIRITLPLLDNGLRTSNLTISRAEFEKTRAALRAKRLAARQEIIVARASVTSARVKIKVTQKTIIHAKKVVQIEQLKYRVGRGTSAEVLEAETALLNAKSLFRQAKRELSIALLAERLALGEKLKRLFSN